MTMLMREVTVLKKGMAGLSEEQECKKCAGILLGTSLSHSRLNPTFSIADRASEFFMNVSHTNPVR